jgi:hypothetical protein
MLTELLAFGRIAARVGRAPLGGGQEPRAREPFLQECSHCHLSRLTMVRAVARALCLSTYRSLSLSSFVSIGSSFFSMLKPYTGPPL